MCAQMNEGAAALESNVTSRWQQQALDEKQAAARRALMKLEESAAVPPENFAFHLLIYNEAPPLVE